MSDAEFLLTFLAWFAGTLVLGVAAVMCNNGKVASVCAIAAVFLVVGVPVYIISQVIGDEENYRVKCRAAHGIPVSAGKAVNCQTPNGKYIDIK